jgi:hypothetical protein
MIHTCTSPGICDWPDLQQLARQHKYEIHFAEHLAEWILWFVDVLEDRSLTQEAGRGRGYKNKDVLKKHKLTLSHLKVSVFSWYFNGSDSASPIHFDANLLFESSKYKLLSSIYVLIQSLFM